VQDVVDLPGGGQVPVQELLNSVCSAVTAAAKEASEDAKDSQAAIAPMVRLTSAREDIGRAAAALAKARAQDGWDEAAYKQKVDEVRAALVQIEAL